MQIDYYYYEMLVVLERAMKLKWPVIVGLFVALMFFLGEGSVMAGNAKLDAQKELKKRLTQVQYYVTQENGTEPPFKNAYYDNHEAGLYVDVVSGEPLFSSTDKFDSGTGWPSFSKAVLPSSLKEIEDHSHGMRRIEIRSSEANSHLGHLFYEKSAPGGKRYCINSASLRFVPVADLKKEGLASFSELFSSSAEEAGEKESPSETALETAILAGGCFWGVEELMRQFPGVVETEVGYTGGVLDSPTYAHVKGGQSGHAEAVKVIFDPKKVSYAELLRYYFRLHDPTTLNRQGNDVGSQYRSAIFVNSDAQRKSAKEVLREVDASAKWKSPVVTQIVTASDFYDAEDYHQNYLQKNPNGYTCHYLRD